MNVTSLTDSSVPNATDTDTPRTVTQAVATAIGLWADNKTSPDSARRKDLLHDKQKSVLDFFAWVDKPPREVTPVDIKLWQGHLEALDLAPATVYGRICQLSSFYQWAIDQGQVKHNPVAHARPKAPRPYQTESTQALGDQDAVKLLATVKEAADSGNLVAMRDYALLLFYFTTGMRRQEIIRLRRGDLLLEPDRILLTTKFKGGDYGTREVADPSVKAALLAYLEARGEEVDSMEPEAPLWVAHDPSGRNQGKPLGSHGFVKNLKRYALRAGLGELHLHQTRHTFARWVGEESGSITEAQDALDHRNVATTKVYLKRVGIKKDKFGPKIAARLGL